MRIAIMAFAGSLFFVAGLAVGLLVGDDSVPKKPDSVVEAIPSREEQRAVVVQVIDGDTVELDNGERVRYLGIDTPEVGPQECYSAEATARNRELIEGQTVNLVGESEDRDRFGRLLRWVFLDDGTFVNAELIWEGYARSFFFGESRYRQVFVQLQLAASETKAGGWSACGWK